MSTANDSLLVNLGQEGFACQDNVGAMNANSQGTATPILSAGTRIVTSVLNGSLILQSVLRNDANNPMVFVINDSPNTIKVFPATGENQNGVLNASLSIPSGQSGFFSKVSPSIGRGGGGGGTTDWRSAVVP